MQETEEVPKKNPVSKGEIAKYRETINNFVKKWCSFISEQEKSIICVSFVQYSIHIILEDTTRTCKRGKGQNIDNIYYKNESNHIFSYKK